LAFLLEAQMPAGTGGLGNERIEGERLFWAHDHNRLVGVVWAQATSRATVTLVPPRLDAAAPPTTGQQLWVALLASLSGVPQSRFAVVLLDDDDDRSSDALLRDAGFERVTPVDFLMATAELSELPPRISLRRVGSHQAVRFQRVLRETTRSQDVAESSSWDRWRMGADARLALDNAEMIRGGDCYFVQYLDRTVGGLVLGRESGDHRALEIGYLGICPEARRQGLAFETLMAVRHLAAREGRLVMAAVDVHHAPAVRAYRRAGFHAWRRRELWAKLLVGSMGRANGSAE
jgi:RimJ/RimL family protein N-acetyltransferase